VRHGPSDGWGGGRRGTSVELMAVEAWRWSRSGRAGGGKMITPGLWFKRQQFN
jgi:hypothetical protein